MPGFHPWGFLHNQHNMLPNTGSFQSSPGEANVQPGLHRTTLNPHLSFCSSLLSAGITNMHHHAWITFFDFWRESYTWHTTASLRIVASSWNPSSPSDHTLQFKAASSSRLLWVLHCILDYMFYLSLSACSHSSWEDFSPIYQILGLCGPPAVNWTLTWDLT